jgi:hypothetical protein
MRVGVLSVYLRCLLHPKTLAPSPAPHPTEDFRPHSPPSGASKVALVGAPNVGKSSLVQLLSSGLPEVQNYPFTTRSIKMGHFYVDGRRHQVSIGPSCDRRG